MTKKLVFTVDEIQEMTEQGEEWYIDRTGVITRFYNGAYVEGLPETNSEITLIAA